MKKFWTLLSIASLSASLFGCAAANQDQARTNQYQSYELGNRTDSERYGVRNTDNTPNTDGTANNSPNTDGTLNNTDKTNNTYKGYFSDVEKGQWYTENIEWAKDSGIMSGFPGGNFQPSKAVTRAEVAAILKNLADKGYLEIPGQLDETPATPTPAPVNPEPATDTTPVPPAGGPAETAPGEPEQGNAAVPDTTTPPATPGTPAPEETQQTPGT